MQNDELRDLIDDLSAKIIINRDDIDEDVMRHPQLILEVGMAYAKALSLRDGLKERVKRVTASLLTDMFEMNPKLAKSKADEEAKCHATVVNVQQEYMDACWAFDRLAALKEAYVARGFALHDFTQMQIARMSFSGSITGKNQPASGSVSDYRGRD